MNPWTLLAGQMAWVERLEAERAAAIKVLSDAGLALHVHSMNGMEQHAHAVVEAYRAALAACAEQTARAERAEAYVEKLKIDVSGFRGTIGEQVDRIHAEMARAERAEAERAYAYRCNEAMREPMRALRAAVGMPAEGEGAVVAKVLRERAEAIAANAELRAALECAISEHEARVGECCCAICDTAKAALSRPDLGRGWASPEDTAQLVGALQMVESDGEFDSLHEVTRKFVVDVLVLLGKAVGDEATPI